MTPRSLPLPASAHLRPSAERSTETPKVLPPQPLRTLTHNILHKIFENPRDRSRVRSRC
jgi:hypothetical protein